MSLQKMDHSVGQLHLEDDTYALEHAHNVAAATAIIELN
jgi:hypothetical protein